MKNEYCKPKIEFKDFNLEKEIAELTVSDNALDWGTGSNPDSVLWE